MAAARALVDGLILAPFPLQLLNRRQDPTPHQRAVNVILLK
jgi:hypothetical protein